MIFERICIGPGENRVGWAFTGAVLSSIACGSVGLSIDYKRRYKNIFGIGKVLEAYDQIDGRIRLKFLIYNEHLNDLMTNGPYYIAPAMSNVEVEVVGDTRFVKSGDLRGFVLSRKKLYECCEPIDLSDIWNRL